MTSTPSALDTLRSWLSGPPPTEAVEPQESSSTAHEPPHPRRPLADEGGDTCAQATSSRPQLTPSVAPKSSNGEAVGAPRRTLSRATACWRQPWCDITAVDEDSNHFDERGHAGGLLGFDLSKLFESMSEFSRSAGEMLHAGSAARKQPEQHAAGISVNDVPEEYLQTLRRFFLAYDADQNGSINPDELYPLLQLLGLDVSREMVLVMLRLHDLNRDVRLDFDESLRLWWECGGRDKYSAKVQEAGEAADDTVDGYESRYFDLLFELLDKDNSGLVSIDELRDTLMQIGDVMTEEEVDAMLRDADDNNSGTLSRREIENMMSRSWVAEMDKMPTQEILAQHVLMQREHVLGAARAFRESALSTARGMWQAMDNRLVGGSKVFHRRVRKMDRFVESNLNTRSRRGTREGNS